MYKLQPHLIAPLCTFCPNRCRQSPEVEVDSESTGILYLYTSVIDLLRFTHCLIDFFCQYFLCRSVCTWCCVETNWHFGINFGFNFQYFWWMFVLHSIRAPHFHEHLCCTLYAYLTIGTLLHICWFAQKLFNGVYNDVWSLKRWHTLFLYKYILLGSFFKSIW